MELHGTFDLAMTIGVVFGAGILWRGHQTLTEEVKTLRESRHEHANILQRVVTMLDDLERRIKKIES